MGPWKLLQMDNHNSLKAHYFDHVIFNRPREEQLKQVSICIRNTSNHPASGSSDWTQLKAEGFKYMALTNFILTVAGVSAVVLLLRSDVKQSASIFRRNVKHIRQWLEEESASASK